MNLKERKKVKMNNLTDEEKNEIRKQKARENSKRYYEKNKEKVLARQKKYVKRKYANDEEFRKKVSERNKKYALKNPEKVKEMKRNWAKKHRQELVEKGLKKPTQKEINAELQQRIDNALNYINGTLYINKKKMKRILKGEK